jgi:cellulose synthase/poly-beta-1,6-N-acetylglucosamine synthase-like glycosyltransferase
MSDLNTLAYILLGMWHTLATHLSLLVWLLPLVLLYELPLMLLVVSGIVRFYHQRYMTVPKQSLYRPKVSCIIACYSEGDAVRQTIRSLVEQLYEGHIEIIAVVDGAVQNDQTYQVAIECAQQLSTSQRTIVVIPKWQRGGRVSSSNAGMSAAGGEVLINIDADTSFNNDMVAEIVPYFADPNVPAVGGALRVRNASQSLVTKMQAIEYLISMQGAKTGLSQWNLLNNISGAFGAFRTSFIRQIGGWNTHTAEDLDLTIRIKQYFARHPDMRIPFATFAIGHTDVPATVKDIVKQRMRWDGDLFFLYMRKHWPSFSSRLLGIKTFLFTSVYGVVQLVAMPFVIAAYSIGLFIYLPFEVLITLTIGIYLFYLALTTWFFVIIVAAVSEQPDKDSKLLLWLPFFPLFAFFIKLVSLFALLNEMVRRAHEESSMAPWWVLKRGKKF